MPLSCPICKAENSNGPACRRCKADLGMLFALEDQRTAMLGKSRGAFDGKQPQDAVRFALAADRIRQGDDTQRWLAVLKLVTGDFGEAWRLYQCVKAHG